MTSQMENNLKGQKQNMANGLKGKKVKRLFSYPFLLLSLLPFWFVTILCAQEKKERPKWWPQFQIYTPPPVEVSTSPVFRTVDPQIIQKLIDLLDELNLGETEETKDSKSFEELITVVTPEGFQLKNRYQHLGVALTESLAWEPIKHVRVISEQNLKQRLTTVARWDHAPQVRAIALISLATLRDKNDIVYFREALWSRNIGIRFAVIEALKIWAFPEAYALLHELTQKDDSLLIRLTAAKGLIWLGDERGIKILRQYLSHPDWFVRALAAKHLGEVGDSTDYDTLLNQLSREPTLASNEFVQVEIAIAALKLFPKKLERDKQEKERKKKKPAPLKPEPIASKPKPPAGLLFELPPLIVTAPRLDIWEPVDSRVNFHLIKMVQEKEDLRIRQQDIDNSPSYRDLDKLITPNGIQLKARYTVLGFLLTEGLAGAKDFQLQDQLIRLAREGKDASVRSYALVALAYSRDRNNLGLFQDALRKDLAQDRFAAVEALQIWGYPEALPLLEGVTKLDPSPLLKVFAAQALLRLGNPNGKDYLIRALDDEDWVVKAMAMRFLGEFGNGEDYNRLLGYLGSQQKKIVQAELCSALLRLYAKKYEEEEKGR